MHTLPLTERLKRSLTFKKLPKDTQQKYLTRLAGAQDREKLKKLEQLLDKEEEIVVQKLTTIKKRWKNRENTKKEEESKKEETIQLEKLENLLSL